MTTRDQIRAVQTRLKADGFDPGPVDGIDGRNTQKAASAWAFAQILKGAPPAAVSVVAGHDLAALAQPKASRPITEIIVHCTAGFNPKDAAGIRRMHMTPGWQGSAKGWSDIGYHAVVRLDGTIEAGRPEAKVGSHCLNHNTGTLGVVYVGGVAPDGKTPRDTRTAEQQAALMAVCQAWIAKYPTIKRVSGHNEYAAKACPSFDVRTDPLGRLV